VPQLRRHFLAALCGAALAGPACSGPIRDAIRERRAAREAEGSTDGSAELEGRTGALKGDFSLPPGARLLRDQAFGSDAAQKLDVYLPAQAKDAPIILMVHGGAWMLGDKAYLPVVRAKVGRWLPKGYVLVSTNYRMSRSPRVMDQADDVAAALAYVQSHAREWGADPARVLLMGHSAGAHLVSLLTSAPTLTERRGVRPWLGTVSLDSAALNVVETMENKHYGFYDRVFGSDRSLWTEASPFHRLNQRPQPMLLVCSTRRDDSCPQAQAFASKARSLGGRATVLPVDMKHGATNTELGDGSDYTARVEAFMRELGLP
jgi:arylformamidase